MRGICSFLLSLVRMSMGTVRAERGAMQNIKGLIGWLFFPQAPGMRYLHDWLAGAASEPGSHDAKCTFEPGSVDAVKTGVSSGPGSLRT